MNPLPPARPYPFEPILGFRFAVFFLVGGTRPNQIDVRFQRVSGLSATVELTQINEGGQNLFTHRVPKKVGYGNLLLERGIVLGGPLGDDFDQALNAFKFAPSNVLVTLLSERAQPLTAWMFLKAFPTRWSTADLNASEDKVLIDTLELAYTRMQRVKV
jgi:phage tail-like protein